MAFCPHELLQYVYLISFQKESLHCIYYTYILLIPEVFDPHELRQHAVPISPIPQILWYETALYRVLH